MFSDQSTLQQFVVRKQNIRKLVGKRFDERYTVPTVTHPPSQIIWRAFSWLETAGLYFYYQGQQ